MFEILENILNEVAPPGWDKWIEHRKEENPEGDHSKWYAIAWAKHRRGEKYTPGKKPKPAVWKSSDPPIGPAKNLPYKPGGKKPSVKNLPGKITGGYGSYKTKPVTLDARQHKGSKPYNIKTLEGSATVHPTDWVMTGVNGERWPVKDHIFKDHYTQADSSGKKWTKVPKKIKATRYLGGEPPVPKKHLKQHSNGKWSIKTQAGHLHVKPGNWIIKHGNEYHPIHHGIFKKTYELNENEVPVNAASPGNIAGLVGDPPYGTGARKRKSLRTILRR